jgi:hypothetical protein
LQPPFFYWVAFFKTKISTMADSIFISIDPKFENRIARMRFLLNRVQKDTDELKGYGITTKIECEENENINSIFSDAVTHY